MKELELVMLVHDSPISRAYLQILKQNNIQPKKIIVMLPNRNGLFFKLIPSFVRKVFGGFTNSFFNNFHARMLLRDPIFQEMIKEIEQKYSLGSGFIEEMYSYNYFDNFSDEIFKLETNGLKDTSLLACLENCNEEYILFTGGGIVPKSLLNIPNKKFLHIHPGFLPDQRGADGVLWSMVNNNKIGVSAIFLDEGIDTGDIIKSIYIESCHFDLSYKKDRPDDQVLYRSIFSFYDPIIRAILLIKISDLFMKKDPIDTIKQSKDKGKYFTFMDSSERKKALKNIFPVRDL